MAGGGAVGYDVALGDALARADDRALVDAGALVGAGELYELVVLDLAGVVAHDDVRGRDALDIAVLLGEDGDAGVHGALVLDAGGDDGRLGGHQGHGLALHVRAHQGAVRVVVFEEGYHRGGDGDHHARGDVDVVHALAVDLDDLVAVAAGDALVLEAAVLVQRLGGLGDDVAVLDVGGHILDLVGHEAVRLADLAEGRDQEAVFIDAGVAREVADEADVRAFWGLYGAEAAVVAVMDVADVEVRPLAAQTAGAEGRHTALVRELGQGVGLVHELGERRGAEELLDGRGDGADIYEALRGDDVEVLQGHALADDALHAGEAYAELVLQQLAHAADAAVAEVVYVVRRADAVSKAAEIVHRGEHVVHDYVLGDEDVDVVLYGLFELVALVLLQELAQDDEPDLLVHADLGRVEVHEVGHVDHAVGEDAHVPAVGAERDVRDAAGVEILGPLAGEDLARLGDELAGDGVGDGGGQLVADEPAGQAELLVELVAAHGEEVVAAAVEEEAVEQRLGALHRRGIARAQLAVDLEQGVLARDEAVLVQRGDDALVVGEDLLELLAGHASGDGVAQAGQPGVGLIRVVAAHGLQEEGDGQLAVFVYADVEDVVRVRLILQPGAVVGDDGGAVGGDLGLVRLLVVVHAGGADDLRDDDALGAVYHEGAARGHEREVAHEDLLLLDLLRLLVAETHAHLERSGIRGVARLALLLGILGLLVHGVVHEAQLQVARVVRDRVHVAEHLAQARVEEPLVGLLLDLQEVRHVLDLGAPCEALPQRLTVVNILWHQCTLLVLESCVHPAGLSVVCGALLQLSENLIE